MIFDYAVTRNGSTPDAVKRENVYTCQSIIARGDNNNDFAVLRLDRKVVNRSPMPIRRQGTIESGEELVLIGHPSELPSKVAANAAVLGNSVKEYFTASTDSYQGNSGSAVFNAENGQIEGILVRGANDFVSDGGCKVSARCTASTCGGEGVTRVSVFARHIPLLSQPQPQPQTGDLNEVTMYLVHPDGLEASFELFQNNHFIGNPGFIGKPSKGRWKLTLKDDVCSDRGSLNSATLVFKFR